MRNDDDVIYPPVLTVCELAEPGAEVKEPANNLVKAGVIATVMGTDLDDLRAAASAWVRGHETFMIEHDIHP